MCNNQNIKIVEGNAFVLLLPLKSRVFVDGKPIDHNIEYEHLQDVVVKIGERTYTPEISPDGLRITEDGTLARGTYDIIVTATYFDSAVRAAYFGAITIVAYNGQSDAQEYIAGSPIALAPAFVIGGVMTDAELEALKQEYREKNAQLDEAIAEWERKAEELDGVAQQGSDPNATNTAILQAIQQSGGDDIAKESTSQDILQKVQNILSANILRASADGWIFNTQHEPENDKLANLIQYAYWAEGIRDTGATDFGGSLTALVIGGMPNLQRAIFEGVEIVRGNGVDGYQYQQAAGSLVLEFPNATVFNSAFRAFQNYDGIGELHMPSVTTFLSNRFTFLSARYLRDIEVGAIETSFSLANWSASDVQPSVYIQNIKNHIAERIADLTGRPSQTITFHSAIKNNILQDQELVDMFINKNWTIA